MFDSIHWHVYGFKGIVDEITGFGVIGNIIENMSLTPETVKTVALISYIVLIVAAYFIGNISPSTILAKRQGLDIKKEGSGNAGTTNALRVMGKKAGVTTLVIDIAKGIVAVLLAEILAGEMVGMYCAVAVIVGHVWPVIYKFKGGKGVATTFGALVAINPMLGIWTLLVVAVVTYLSKRMSAGSIAGAICFPVICLFNEPEFIVWGTLLAFIVLIKHRANIVRLLEGTEPKLGFLDKDQKTETASESADETAVEEVAVAAEAQPEEEKEPVVDENIAEEATVVAEAESAEEEHPAADTESAEEEAEQPVAVEKTEKYKRPQADKTVKKNGKKKKSYPNKNKNNGGGQKKNSKGSSHGKNSKNSKSKGNGNKGKSKKKSGKKK